MWGNYRLQNNDFKIALFKQPYQEICLTDKYEEVITCMRHGETIGGKGKRKEGNI